MGLVKKASMCLGSILLACNVGCRNSFHDQNIDFQRPLEDKVKPEKPIKIWQYPVNILGGLLLSDFTHESGHALAALAMGMEIEDYHPIRFIPGEYSEYAPIWVKVTNKSYLEASDSERSIFYIAGPVADMTLVELINYNLRNGKISEKYQSFWATTNLVSRWCLLNNAIKGLKQEAGNDFHGFAENTGISEETSLGVITLYTALSAKRIWKELNVAIGRDTYPVDGGNGRIDLLPYQDGLMVSYSLKF